MKDQDIEKNESYAQAMLRTLIFLFHQETVLLIKGAPTKKRWANKYNGVGGHIHRDEDIHTAAIRELREETSITDAQLEMCGTVHIPSQNGVGVCLFIFAAELNERPTTLASSEGELHWVPLSTLASQPILPDLPVIIPRVRRTLHSQSIFHALYTFEDDRTHINIHPAE